ncbi:MAG: KpsF/GutQ family sugar-phosphate isomerase [Saprospiraceae bacterium]|nr:KpsF/GutQ family sugar-phosphate isomerase [Saprospiraceae bacterium]
MDWKELAKTVFDIEAQAILGLKKQLDTGFSEAVNQILQTQGRVVICGMGKSGIIGKKIAATLSSTGTASFFLHPSEALHGDLGMLRAEDCFISISNSGETDELLQLLPHVNKLGLKHITLVGKRNSTLAKYANIVLLTVVNLEASSLSSVPMASTTATLAMGDALAAALIEARAFKRSDFALFHPGGNLGKRLLTQVEQLMQTEELPIVPPTTPMREVLWQISKGKLGLVAICSTQNELLGVITDGDLRRALEEYNGEAFFGLKAVDIMTQNPKKITQEASIAEAEQLMLTHKITTLVVTSDKRVVGMLANHQLKF